MSECVVRMELPACCDDCPMEYDGFMCRAIHTAFYPLKDRRYIEPLIDPSKERLPNCPIVCVLPEGHGPIVDFDSVGVGYTDEPYIEPEDIIVQAERREG